MDTNHFLILHGNIRSSNQKFVNFKRFLVDFKFSFKIMFISNLDDSSMNTEAAVRRNRSS